MRTSLRTRLLGSHLLLAALLIALLIGAAVGFARLGRSVDHILRDNYKSVVAAQQMKEALERIDSAAQFAVSGETARARKQFVVNRKDFEAAYRTEAGNITEPGEQQVADALGREFPDYAAAVEQHLARPSSRTYFEILEPRFLALKGQAQRVLDLNQQAILRADARAKREAQLLSGIGVGVTALAVVLSLVFAAQSVRGALAPLRLLAQQAEEIGAGRLGHHIELRRADEIGQLAAAFNDMADNLRAARTELEERAVRAERTADVALDSLYDPVVVVDAAERVVHLNRAAEALFGRELHAAGRSIRDIVRDERIASAVEGALREGRTFAEEGDAASVRFGERTYRLRVTPMPGTSGARPGAVAVLEDVTYLREVDRLKTEFIGVASHELRTPVTSLLLAVQLLQEGAAGALTPEQAQVVAAQREDLERLERLLRDLLDLTRLESGALPPRRERVSLAELFDGALATVRSVADTKGVTLSSAPLEGDAVLDRGQITRALVNLLGNAIRHTPPGGQVRLQAQRREGEISLTVLDTGEGIPKEWLPRLFERFVQVPGATRGGSGLGLSLVKTIAEAHGGTASAESEIGKGSAFTLTIPQEQE